MKKDGSYKFVSFETCSATLQDNAVIRDAALFIMGLKPLLNIRDECSVQARSFLSAFLIASYPEEVLGGFSENVVSKKLIYKCASRVVHAMSKFFLSQSSQITSASLVHMAEMYQRFFFSFHAWRGADIYKMTNELKLSVIQTWSALLFETEAVKLIDSMVTKLENVNDYENRYLVHTVYIIQCNYTWAFVYYSFNGTHQFRSPMVYVLPYVRLENSDHTKSVFDRRVLLVSVPLLLLF